MHKLAPMNWTNELVKIAPRIAEEGRACDAEKRYVGANIALLREHGFLELAVPLELGGGGLSRLELAAMLRTVAHHCSATALVLAMHTHTVAAATWRWHNQKAPVDGLLKRVAAERLQLLSSGGSDWLTGSGTAEKVDGGYKVNGRKIFASGAPSADLFMTGAVEETADGPTALQFGIPVRSTGISIVENWDTLGMRGTASHSVKLDEVFVADAAIAARRPSGLWHPSFHLISMVAFPLIYAVYTGIAEAARDIALTMASRKRSADVVDAVGRMDTELTATRIAHRSMIAFAETSPPGAETTNTIFMHRALVARSAIKTVELAMIAAGGEGYFRSTGLERLFRDIQAARFHPLQDGPQQKLAGRVALGLPIDG
ncbi:acyl-CoA dehydrogenase family protein [Reyranella sp.]|uniref:acyl-CoA dehydrogenase family protein n=1 Tax=Reyranella sp. TaxID=1929291 RepID=UPI0025D6F0C2|nr:acyl-CoA dehydrogenase family protein [Reyranella sp.]